MFGLWVLTLGKLLPISKEAVADPVPKHLLFGLVASVFWWSCYHVLEGGYSWPYMGTVNNSNKTWHVLISVYNTLEKIFKSHRGLEVPTWCSPSLLNCTSKQTNVQKKTWNKKKKIEREWKHNFSDVVHNQLDDPLPFIFTFWGERSS